MTIFIIDIVNYSAHANRMDEVSAGKKDDNSYQAAIYPYVGSKVIAQG
ncbi:MAG: hypothetical protein ICV63_02525 [Coleofasciculus sp. Co-bin14]|nr:hypothetical protein [Coleofasciculus sp. Co-bin14]